MRWQCCSIWKSQRRDGGGTEALVGAGSDVMVRTHEDRAPAVQPGGGSPGTVAVDDVVADAV